MPGNLGNAVLTLKVKATEFKQGLKDAKVGATNLATHTETQAGRIGKAFSGVGGKIKGVAGQVPLIGTALTSLMTPVGAATLAVGALVGLLSSSISKIINTEKELRPMVERSGIAAEKLQELVIAAERLGSEDALEGVVDSSQELQLKLGDVANNAQDVIDRFTDLGVSGQDLLALEPEAAFLAVIDALQNVESLAERKLLADDLLGGSSEKLAGLINISGDAFADLTKDIQANADIISGEGLDAAKDFQSAWTDTKDEMGNVSTSIGVTLLPALTNLLNLLNTAKSPIGTFGTVIVDSVVTPIGNAADKINALIDTFKNWDTTWNNAKTSATNALNDIITAYNNSVGKIPGVAEIDMLAVTGSIETVGTAAEVMEADVGTAAGNASTSMGDTATAAGTMATGMTGSFETAATAAETLAANIKTSQEGIAASTGTMEEDIGGGYERSGDKAIAWAEINEAAADRFAATYEANVARSQESITDFGETVDDMEEDIGGGLERNGDKVIAWAEIYDEQADVAGQALKDAATDTKTALNEMVDDLEATALAAERETQRIVDSWDNAKTNQEPIVQAMKDAGISFEDVIVAIADNAGVSFVEMADSLADSGVKFGDVMALMASDAGDAAGTVIASMADMAAAAAAAAADVQASVDAANAARATQSADYDRNRQDYNNQNAAAIAINSAADKRDRERRLAEENRRRAAQGLPPVTDPHATTPPPPAGPGAGGSVSPAVQAALDKALDRAQAAAVQAALDKALGRAAAEAARKKAREEAAAAARERHRAAEAERLRQLSMTTASAAKGGIFMNPNITRIAETKPEAVIPLDKLPSIMAGIPGGGGRSGRGGSPIIVQGSIVDWEGLIQAIGKGEVQLDRRGRQRVFR